MYNACNKLQHDKTYFYANVYALLKYGIIFVGEDNESSSIFKLPKKGYGNNCWCQ
jgi:hypothetical protein